MRILLTQLIRIGDVLMTTPAVRAVREAYPDAHIVYLTVPPSDQLFRHNPHVDETWPVPLPLPMRDWPRWIARLRRGGFDLAIDFHGNPVSAALTRLSGARRRVGLDLRGRRLAYTDAVPKPRNSRYAPAHKLALLSPLGIEPASTAMELKLELGLDDGLRQEAAALLAGLGVHADDLLVALMPASRQPYKVWPLERWAALADWMIETHGAKVLPVWGPGEETFVDSVRAHMRHDPLPPYPVPSLLGLGALLERATLYVGNDVGPRHFAIAVGTPTVGVFGKPRPESWTPPEDPCHRALAHDPGCKSACTYPRCDLACIRGVDFDTVRGAVTDLLNSMGHETLR